ncbi:MAG TPA: hypothetical protein VJI71_03120 [Candidatus Norongarragalinales archaeon]|nr:hypothetical protein [Candidatus Norongarragalinales archaeon]
MRGCRENGKKNWKTYAFKYTLLQSSNNIERDGGLILKNALSRFVFAVLGLLFVSSSVSALTLYSSADHLTLRGVEGKVYFWMTNTDGEEKSVSFSADVGALNGFFDDAGMILPERGTKGTWLHLSAPACFNGVEKVDVQVEVCTLEGNCDILSKQLFVAATPSADSGCSSYFQSGFVSSPSYNAPFAYGDGSMASSTLSYATYADSTYYDVEISGSSSCPKVKPGDSITQYFTLINKGGASSFDLAVVNRNDVNAFVSQEQVSLSRREAEDISIDISPNKLLAGGYYYVPLQIVRNGVVIAEKQVCVNVEDVVDARVVLPKAVEGRVCDGVSVEGIVYNTGTAEDTYAISVALPSGRSVDAQPNYFALKGGDSASFKIFIGSDYLKEGVNGVTVTAKSSLNNIVGQAAVAVIANSCATPAPVVNTVENQEQNVLEITVSVKNDLDEELKQVSASIEGIPSSWKVESAVIDVPQQSTANLTVKLTQTTSEEASAPVLVLKSGLNEISRKSLSPIQSPGGATGLFTALSQNTLFIALLIAVALLVVILTSRRNGAASSSDSISQQVRGAVVNNLTGIRDAARK